MTTWPWQTTNNQLKLINAKLDVIKQQQENIVAALDDLMAADQALKDEVAQFLADLAAQISGGVSAAQAETVVSDINAQVAALKAADPAAPA